MDKINYTKIFIVVLFAVLIANITTGILFKVWIEYEARVAIEQMQKSVQASKLKRDRIAAESKLKYESQKRQLERQKLINDRENRSQASIRKSNMETCNFWRQAYSKENNGYNKAMLDSACRRAMSP